MGLLRVREHITYVVLLSQELSYGIAFRHLYVLSFDA